MCVDVVPTKLVKTARSKEDAYSEFAVHNGFIVGATPSSEKIVLRIHFIAQALEALEIWTWRFAGNIQCNANSFFFDSVLKAHNVGREP